MTKQVYSSVPLYTLKTVKAGKVKYPSECVGTPNEARTVLQAYLEDKDCEHLAVMMIDGQHQFLGLALISTGTIDGLQGYVRDTIKHCIVHRASAFILGHNHPSGKMEPSNQDIVFTERIMQAADLMGVPMLDHVIVSSSNKSAMYSFLDSGLLGKLKDNNKRTFDPSIRP